MRHLLSVFLFAAIQFCNLTTHGQSNTTGAVPAVFENAFTSDTTWSDSMPFFFRQQSMGRLAISSHHIIAGQLSLIKDGAPFLNYLPNGNFPVELALASESFSRTQADSFFFPAYIRIVLAKTAVQEWRFMLTKNYPDIPLDGNRAWSKENTDDTISFIGDAAVIEKMDRAMKERLIKNATEKINSQFFFINVPGKGIFVGDAIFLNYQVYVGYDAGNRPCRLLFDLGYIQIPASFFRRNKIQ